MAQKTSLSFISCYASRVPDYVYLQRGFRNYGSPQVKISLIFSLNYQLNFRKYHLDWITQLTLRDYVTVRARHAFQERHIQQVTAIMNAVKAWLNRQTLISFSILTLLIFQIIIPLAMHLHLCFLSIWHYRRYSQKSRLFSALLQVRNHQ